MLKRIALLLSILLLPVFCVAGFYGFLWWRVTEAADEMVTKASPFAELSYNDVRIDLVATEIALVDIRVAPLGGTDQFNIDEISLKAPDWSQMLRLGGDLGAEPWPDALSLHLKGFFFRLDSALMEQWMQLAQQGQPQDMTVVGQFCSRMQGADLLQAMGYRVLGADIELAYSFDAVEGRWDVDISADTAEVGDFAMGISLKTSSASLSKSALAGSQTALRSVQSHFSDKGFNRRFREYCATQSGITEEQFDQALREEFEAMIGYAGVGLTDELYQGFVDMYRPAANITFRMRPDTPLGQVQAVQITSLDSFMSVLNPALLINGKPVSLAGIKLQKPVKRSASSSVAAQDPMPLARSALPEGRRDGLSLSPSDSVSYEKDMVPPVANEPHRPAYRAVNIADVREHIGHRARMVTYFGRRIEGRILEIDHHEMLIEQRMQRGVATYSIALEKVAEIEVYR